MSKTVINALIVVEGTTDVSLLTSFLDAEIVTTNGSDVPRETIDYILEASKRKDVIVLTDPDYPGKRIRDVLDRHIPNLKHAYIPKEKAIKHHKVGVAESDKETILDALSHITITKSPTPGNLTYSDLLELKLVGENSGVNKENVETHFHLGYGNGKTLLKRLNAMNIDRKQLEKFINGCK